MTNRTLCLIAALSIAGCSTNDHNSGLVISGTVLGAAATAASACTFTAGTPEVDFPIFNPAASELATTGFVVKNELSNPSILNPALRTDSTNFQPHQAVVNYEIPGATVAQQIIKVSGGSVQSGGSVPVLVPLFSPTAVFTAVQAFAATGGVVRTTTRIEGFLDDGSTVSTSEHDYVIQVVPSCTPATDPTCVVSTTCF